MTAVLGITSSPSFIDLKKISEPLYGKNMQGIVEGNLQSEKLEDRITNVQKKIDLEDRIVKIQEDLGELKGEKRARNHYFVIRVIIRLFYSIFYRKDIKIKTGQLESAREELSKIQLDKEQSEIL